MENREEKQQLLDQSYAALEEGNWSQARDLFARLLREDPALDFACLGMAMAAEEIHTRQELFDRWEALREDPKFRGYLAPASENFLRWLDQNLGRARQKNRSGETRQAADQPEDQTAKTLFRMPDFSAMGPGRKLLLLFAGIQVALYLLTVFFFWKGQPEYADAASALMADFVVAAIMTGLPVILGPVYGNAIVEGGRFQKLLKVLNNGVGILGSGLFGMLATAFLLSLEGAQPERVPDRFYGYLFITAFLIHLLALILPHVIKRVEKG